VVGICRRHRIPFRLVADLNGHSALRFAGGGFDFAVYLGGGILRRDFLRAVSGPVLNAHDGPLPAIRGVSALEWALFLGIEPEITLHRIDAGIDTGGVYLRRRLVREDADDLDDLRVSAIGTALDLL
jgi:methionyl-tRNA formyltransferase